MPMQTAYRNIFRLPTVITMIALVALMALLSTIATQAQQDSSGLSAEVDAAAVLDDADGRQVGTVRFLEEESFDTVAVLIQVNQLPPGFHSLYIYDAGNCEVSDQGTFDSAGQRYYSEADQQREPDQQRLTGAMPPILVMEDGSGAMSFRTDRLMIDELFDDDGSAVIIEAGTAQGEVDATEPENNVQRVACGVIQEGDLPQQQPDASSDEQDMAATPMPEGDTGMGEEGIFVVAFVDQTQVTGTSPAGPVRFNIENRDAVDRICELRPANDDTAEPIFSEIVTPGDTVDFESELQDGDYRINCMRPDGTSDETTMGDIQISDDTDNNTN